MAWNRNTGGRPSQNDNRGPWSNPQPSGGSGNGGRGDQPPDLDDILRRTQERLRRLFSRGGGSAAFLILVVLGGAWVLSGTYQVGPAQNGVVQRFGKFVALKNPGLQWHFPWPIETAQIIDVRGVQKTFVGGDTDDSGHAPADSDQSLMLTSDRNFLKVKFLVQWLVSDAKKYAFNVEDPKNVVRTTAQSAMREVVGRGSFDQLQTSQRTATEEEVKRVVQQALDSYNSGIHVLLVNLQTVDPPDEALKAARDVQTAGQDKETARNKAEAYQNNIIPTARGQAQKVIQAAEAYKAKVIADAQGESARFLSVYEQYKKAPEVTRRRMYLETMEDVFGGTNKVVIDRSAQGVVPYLPLGSLNPAAPSNPPAGPAATGGN